MKITVDTQKDSKEEIDQVIGLLQQISNSHIKTEIQEPVTGLMGLFDSPTAEDQDEETPPETTDEPSEELSEEGTMDMLGNKIIKRDDDEPKVTNQEDEDTPQIEIVHY
ncbi:MAG: hypothetical protein ABIH34_08505 [Nanoarchaeota archaeon]